MLIYLYMAVDRPQAWLSSREKDANRSGRTQGLVTQMVEEKREQQHDKVVRYENFFIRKERRGYSLKLQ